MTTIGWMEQNLHHVGSQTLLQFRALAGARFAPSIIGTSLRKHGLPCVLRHSVLAPNHSRDFEETAQSSGFKESPSLLWKNSHHLLNAPSLGVLSWI